MTAAEGERLAKVEVHQIDMTNQIAELRAEMRANTEVTRNIERTLDGLSGGKQALMWLTGIVALIGATIAGIVWSHK